jgi:pyruvate dehydrogenase E1 component beta subunit
VRTQQGSQPGACAQHSQSLEAILAHIPGLRLCVPATAQDAYDIGLAAIACDDPTIIIENRNLYFTGKQDVVVGGPVGRIGGSLTRRAGTDVTIVAWGSMTLQALAAARQLEAESISAEVIDARWLNPFDYEAVIASIARTGRLVVAHEANITGGFSAQIVAEVAASGVRLLSPAVRVGAPDVRLPAAPALLAAVMPDARSVARAVRATVGSEVSA